MGFVVVPALTLRDLPYSIADTGEPVTIVEITAHQWYWVVSRTEIPANQPIIFRAASQDVNHGFGIYDDSTRLIAQVQVMPGYVNELAVEFDQPGTYKLMCLEYCGLAHHAMEGVINVVASASLAQSQEEL